MLKSFVRGVLSSQKQRQRYYYFKNGIAFVSGLFIFVQLGGVIGFALGIVGAFIAIFTIAPIIAFLICLIEQMAS